jgi:hypothetical protein
MLLSMALLIARALLFSVIYIMLQFTSYTFPCIVLIHHTIIVYGIVGHLLLHSAVGKIILSEPIFLGGCF